MRKRVSVAGAQDEKPGEQRPSRNIIKIFLLTWRETVFCVEGPGLILCEVKKKKNV